MMHREWQALGHAPPLNTNDRIHKSFTTFLPEPRMLAAPEVGRLVDVLEGEMTMPDKPRSRLQRYRLTESGEALRAQRRRA